MRYLFNDWGRVSFKIRNSPHVFLFFDYDGTLTPIVSRPDEAVFPPAVKKLIRRLNKDPKFTVVIISGRSLKNIKRIVGLEGIIYAGNHGLELEGKGIKSFKLPSIDAIKGVIKRLAVHLRRELEGIKGAYIEDKGVTLSVHYRLAGPRDKALIDKKFKEAVWPYVSSGKVRISSGKKVLEVRPNLDWDKGKAVSWLIRRRENTFIVYFGDDVTDLDAFRVIKGKGISIFVGRPKKGINADYFVKGPKDVKRFIARLSNLNAAKA